MPHRPPNVLILFSDQHNAGVLGCEGHPDIQTPNLDRLAGMGTRFSRAYCQDAICMPSRCSIFSGQYPRTLGCLSNGDASPVMDQVVSMQRCFQAAGYHTAAFGKRHLEAACDLGWTQTASHFIKESPEDNYVDWVVRHGCRDAFNRDWAAEFGRGVENTPNWDVPMPFALMSAQTSQLPENRTMEAFTKQRTVDLIESFARRDQPFFCWSSYYRPHQPYTPLPRYLERFDRSCWGAGRNKGDSITMPASLRQPVETLPPMLQDQHQGTNRVWRFDLAREDEQLYRDGIAAYYALVEEIDDHIGDVLDALHRTGQLDNTIVVYTSDHGDFAGNHGMLEKCAAGHNVYEDTIRVPLIFAGASGIRGGQTLQDLAESVDLYPTLLALCGVEPMDSPFPLEGRSLAASLRGEGDTGRGFCVTENHSQSTVVTERYKLGIWQEPRKSDARDDRAFGDMLFDRETDPLEVTNLAGQPDFAEIEAKLRAMYVRWDRSHPWTTATSHSAII